MTSSTNREVALGLEIGGTHTSIVLTNSSGDLLFSASGPTNVEDPRSSASSLLDAAILNAEAHSHHVTVCGLSVCGPVDAAVGLCLESPILPSLPRHNLPEWLADRLCLPYCCVENDTNAAAYAEWRFGIGAGASHLLLLSLGTGVGGAFLQNGSIYYGYRGYGAEFGHIVVAGDDAVCDCGGRGCLGAVMGGRAIDRAFRRMTEAGERSIVSTPPDGGTSRVDVRAVIEAAKAGDAVSERIWQEAVLGLSKALVTLVNCFSPDRIVLTGGISRAGRDLLDPLNRDMLTRMPFGASRILPVLQGVLELPGPLGAAHLAFARTLSRKQC